MKINVVPILLAIVFISCTGKKSENGTKPVQASLIGSWKLITGIVIEKNDTIITDYTKNVSFIKIINQTHFAFLQHDLNSGKDSSAVFVAGGGSYTLNDSVYTEHLDYCSARNWEGNKFTFTVALKNDTLIQKGVEVVEDAGINRTNIEKYIRIK